MQNLKKYLSVNNPSGLTLLELLITITIMGMIMVGLQHFTGSALSAYDYMRKQNELLARARHAMERMVMFVQETDDVDDPKAGQQKQWLVVSERVLDTYNNADQTYVTAGDGYLDADNDADGLVNEDASDPKEYVRFDIDKAIANNWKLTEQSPDYSTAAVGDTVAPQVLSEHVTDLQFIGLTDNLIEIQLTLNNGKAEVSLKTRVIAKNVE